MHQVLPKRIGFRRTMLSTRFQNSNNQTAPRRSFNVRGVENRNNNNTNYERAEPSQRVQKFSSRQNISGYDQEDESGSGAGSTLPTRQRLNGGNRIPSKNYGMQRQNFSNQNGVGQHSQRQNYQQRFFLNKTVFFF